ncbi:MAG: hypothetical protein COA84_14155 [Robiginitomaculum sp.]|nr:MAG: hypothetical protein COA84_14155 [Robiginitomaculum sp.]
MKHVEEIERLKLKNEMLTVRNEMLYNSNAALIKGNEKLMDLISVNARTLLICGFLFSAANVLMFTAYYYK